MSPPSCVRPSRSTLPTAAIAPRVLDSTRNILYLIADDRTFALPVGFSERLHARLQKEMEAAE